MYRSYRERERNGPDRWERERYGDRMERQGQGRSEPHREGRHQDDRFDEPGHGGEWSSHADSGRFEYGDEGGASGRYGSRPRSRSAGGSGDWNRYREERGGYEDEAPYFEGRREREDEYSRPESGAYRHSGGSFASGGYAPAPGSFGPRPGGYDPQRSGYEPRSSGDGESWSSRSGQGSSTMRTSRGRFSEGNGPHRGRGPKGYQRSDERIREDVSEALTDDAEVDARNIEVSVSNGVVTLKGEVLDRQTKRMAEDCAESVSGVSEVINQLRLAKDSQDSGGGKERTLTPAKAGESQTQQQSRAGASASKSS